MENKEEITKQIKVLGIGEGFALDCDGFQSLALDKRELLKQIGADIYAEQENAAFMESYGFEITYTIKPIKRSPF